MKDLATYHDENRLIHETDRRLHAADMELSGGYIQVVPAVAKKLAAFVQEGALAWSEGQTQQAEALQDDAEEARRLRGERWWISEWRRKDGLYRLKRLTGEERALTRLLLGRPLCPHYCPPAPQSCSRRSGAASRAGSPRRASTASVWTIPAPSRRFSASR